MKEYNNDTSAHAVVLNEHGRAEIVVTNNDEIRLVYEYHVKIKIFDKSAFDEGNIELPYYKENDEYYQQIEDIKAVTTYTDDNGGIVKAELDPHAIYTTKDGKHQSTIKFAMPGIRPGCIIEYKYRLVSPFISTFHEWEFQSNLPKINSEYDVHIPAIWTYNAAIRGSLKMTKNNSEVEKGCFTFNGFTADCSHFVYGMTDVPAFIEEDNMTSRHNFLSAITFQLTGETSLSNGGNIKIAKEWKDIDYDLKHSEYFGNQLKKEGLFKDTIAHIIAGKTDELDKAKAIYAYIKTAIKWDKDYEVYSDDGIRQALNKHSGSAAEVNFCLFAALKAAGFDPEAVMVSTREHGFVNKLYPVEFDFNYLVVKLDIGDKSYLLDATEPLLPFGMLPKRCLNDQGRVMSLDKPSYWIDMNTPQKKNDIYQLDLTLQTDGKIKGTITHFCLGYAAYEERAEIKKFNSVDEYIESLNERSNKFKIIHADISNLDSLDESLTEKFEVEIKEYNNADLSRLTLNPVIQDRITINPFKLAERTYPVDMGMSSITRYTMVMHLPDDYIVDTNPQKVSYSLPNNGGSFLTDYIPDEHSFTFSYAMQLNKSIYAPEEYPYLKEFYNKIILSEKGEMIFKKKI